MSLESTIDEERSGPPKGAPPVASPAPPPFGAVRALALILGLGLLLAALYLQDAGDLLLDPGLAPGLQLAWHGPGTETQPFLHRKDLGLLAVDTLLLLPAWLLLALGFGGWNLSRRRLPAWPIWVLALLVTLATLGIRAGALGGAELTDDDLAYQVQAEIFLRGRLSLPLPEDPGLFETPFVHQDLEGGRYLTKYYAGWPLLLAPFLALGLIDLLPALLAGLLVLLFHDLARRLDPSEQTARGAAWLLALSPFLLLTGATLASQPACLLFLLLSLRLAVVGEDEARPGAWLLAGLAWGLALNIRPLSAAAAVPAAALHLLGHSRPRARLGWVALGGLVGVATFLGYNWLQTGSAWLPVQTWILPYERLGFENAADPALRHTPLRALVNLTTNLVRLNTWALGWPASLLLVAALVRRRLRPLDRLCLGWAGCHLGAHLLYFFAGISLTGPLYSFELLPALLWLTARGIEEMATTSPTRRAQVTALVLLAAAYSGLHYLPRRIASVAALAARIQAPFRQLPVGELPPPVVVCQFRNQPVVGWRNGWPVRHPALVRNDEPLFTAPTQDGEALARLRERQGRGRIFFLVGDYDHGFRALPWKPRVREADARPEGR